jgi:MoaA/NifB/PqqE/SkfB family radical SAM enzyme
MHGALRHARSLFLKTRPIHLTLFVTARCNARCPFCLYAGPRDAPPASPELSAAEVRRVARSAGRLLWVLFSGGEPYLREDLVELSAIFHDESRVPFLTIPTNGLLPEVVAERTREILARCPESAVVVKLSIDGVGDDHDRVRRSPGAFRKVMAAYEALARLADAHPNLELGVNTLFSAETQAWMDGIVDLVRRLDRVRSHTITMVRGTAAASGGIDLTRYARAMERLEAPGGGVAPRVHRFAGAALKAAQDRVRRRLVERTLAERRRVATCHAGRLDLVLTERGELHPCEERWDLSFGNVRDAGYDVRGMLRSPRAARVLEEIDREACACTHECNLLSSVLFDPRGYPALLREWARLRLGRTGRGGRPGAASEQPMTA